MEEAALHSNIPFDFCRELTFIYDWQVLNVNIILDDEEIDKSSKNQNLILIG